MNHRCRLSRVQRSAIVSSACLLGMLVALASCSSKSPTKPQEPQPGEVVLAAKAVVLTPEAAPTALVGYAAGGQITLTKSFAQENGVGAGTVLISGETTLAPEGFLRKVVSVTEDGDVLRLVTQQAALTEAVAGGSILAARQLTPAAVDSVSVVEGVEYLPAKANTTGGFAFELDLVAWDLDGDDATTFDQIRVTGELAMSAGLELELEFAALDAGSRLDGALLVIARATDTDLAATYGVAADVPAGIERRLATIHGGVVTLSAGPLPVCVAMDIDVLVRVAVDGEVGLGLGCRIAENSRFGVQYGDGAWTALDVHERTVPAAVYSFDGDLDAELGVIARTALRVYGVPGPQITGRVHAQADVELLEVGAEGAQFTGEVAAASSAQLALPLMLVDPALDDVAVERALWRAVVWQDTWTIGQRRIIIDPEPDHLAAPWQIAGPEGFAQAGSGNAALEDPPAGSYTLTWGAVAGWNPPNPSSVTRTLTSWGTLTFAGVYTAQPGTVTVSAVPSYLNPPWQLTGPGGFNFAGTGNNEFTEMVAGVYAITWGPVEGWLTPSPATVSQTLDAGGAVTFTGVYNEDTGPPPNDAFVFIPPGKFLMGSPIGEPGRTMDETQHEVTLTRGFFMSQFPVTEQWWRQVMGGTPTESRRPQHYVSWDMAIQFCNELSLREGLTKAYIINGSNGDVTWNREANGYRLPTEAEWEYACRATSKAAFNNNTNCLSSTTEANYDGRFPLLGCPTGLYRGHPTTVGTFRPNHWGLYDMHGNILEWTWDGWRTYTTEAQIDPVTDAAPGQHRVFRGGIWHMEARECRSAFRNTGPPNWEYHDYGFRPVRTVF